jgi:hypothetical protein
LQFEHVAGLDASVADRLGGIQRLPARHVDHRVVGVARERPVDLNWGGTASPLPGPEGGSASPPSRIHASSSVWATGEHHRKDEDADQAERDQATDDASSLTFQYLWYSNTYGILYA